MPAPKRLTLAQMREVRVQLEEVERNLLDYIDPENSNCAVPADARKVSANYLDSWALAPVQGVLQMLDRMLDLKEGN